MVVEAIRSPFHARSASTLYRPYAYQNIHEQNFQNTLLISLIVSAISINFILGSKSFWTFINYIIPRFHIISCISFITYS